MFRKKTPKNGGNYLSQIQRGMLKSHNIYLSAVFTRCLLISSLGFDCFK